MKLCRMISLLIAFLALGSSMAWGYHDSLHVVVNGVRLHPTQIRALEQLSCGPIPSGRYWLDVNTGIWGYERGPAQGRIGERCAGGGSGSQSANGGSWTGGGGYGNEHGVSFGTSSGGYLSYTPGVGTSRRD